MTGHLPGELLVNVEISYPMTNHGSNRHRPLLPVLIAFVIVGWAPRWPSGIPQILSRFPAWGAGGEGAEAFLEIPGTRTDRAEIYQFRLRGTAQAPGASGLGNLTLAPSPFGVAVTPDGFLVYELELATSGLLVPKGSAKQRYIIWMTTPALDRFQKLGVLGESGKWRGPLSGMNKFLLLVTLEVSSDVEERRGPVVIRGVSPSGLLVSYDNHELFSNMPHPE